MSKFFKPDSMPSMVPYLTVVNAEKSIDFYRNAFGFELIDASRDDAANIQHAEMRYGEVVIMFCPEGAFSTISKAPVTQNIVMPISLYVYCPDIDALYEQALKHGAKSKMSPNNGFWGDRFCALTDLDGYEWSFATYLGLNILSC
jgi:PhnB protein